MSELLKRNLPTLKRLRRMPTKDRNNFLRTCNRDIVDAICECAKNVLQGNVPLTSAQYKKLHRYKKVLRALSNQRSSINTRRKLLQQKGGFFGGLLGPLIGLASSLFGGLLNRRRERSE